MLDVKIFPFSENIQAHLCQGEKISNTGDYLPGCNYRHREVQLTITVNVHIKTITQVHK